tara:strand:+ start:1623 stop:2030 length:408 start_codon:yes stop_codon:yes gene_type:complete
MKGGGKGEVIVNSHSNVRFDLGDSRLIVNGIKSSRIIGVKLIRKLNIQVSVSESGTVYITQPLNNLSRFSGGAKGDINVQLDQRVKYYLSKNKIKVDGILSTSVVTIRFIEKLGIIVIVTKSGSVYILNKIKYSK